MKTTQKRWVSILLAILMVASTASVCLLSASAMRENRAYTTATANVPDEVSSGSPARDDSGTCGENLTWTFNAETGELTISGTGRMDDFSNWNVGPWTSSNQNHIKTVTISDGVTTIGEDAFGYCTNITSVTIPDSVTTICEGAFHHCWSLADVSIPSSVTTIGENAFFDCSSITNVTIPASVTEIGENAFQYCESLAAITVDASNPAYSSGADGVLYNKNKTQLIQYPNGNARDAFEIPDGVTTIGDGAFYGCTKLLNITIPNSVTTIGRGTFFDCSELTDVTIPDSVTIIGASAFYGCESLTSVMIPSGTTIGNLAFCDCKSLTSFSVDERNRAYSSDADGVLYNKNKTLLIQYPIGNLRSTFTIPSSVTTIDERAFYDCVNLMGVMIPDSVKTIGEEAFSFCTSFTNITIPDSVRTISSGAFSYCKGLTSVFISSGVKALNSGTFYGCWDLEIVMIPDSVTFIDNCVFEDCTSLQSITIPHSVSSIGERAFSNCRNLPNVTIPNSVTTIGDRAFEYCVDLTFAHIPASVTNIGSYCFGGCPAFICSSTADCYAKTYADANEIEFRVCTEHEPAVAIRNFVPEKAVDYRTTLTFTAEDAMFTATAAPTAV